MKGIVTMDEFTKLNKQMLAFSKSLQIFSHELNTNVSKFYLPPSYQREIAKSVTDFAENVNKTLKPVIGQVQSLNVSFDSSIQKQVSDYLYDFSKSYSHSIYECFDMSPLSFVNEIKINTDCVDMSDCILNNLESIASISHEGITVSPVNDKFKRMPINFFLQYIFPILASFVMSFAFYKVQAIDSDKNHSEIMETFEESKEFIQAIYTEIESLLKICISSEMNEINADDVNANVDIERWK